MSRDLILACVGMTGLAVMLQRPELRWPVLFVVAIYCVVHVLLVWMDRR